MAVVGIRTPEDFVDSAIATLRENLPTQIDAVNAARDDFVLDPIPDDRYLFGVEDPIIRTPSIEVAIPDVDFEDPSIEQERWEGRYALVLRVWVEDLDPGRLLRRNYRYASAILNVLVQPEALGPAAIERIRLRNRVNPETNEGEEHLGSMLIVITATTDEIRP